ncbi:ribokinase [Carbonactinospora thermoautotrophica]|uniref:ribokinase n=1 Tax=Carbonactinospora thermoautotrophica TaxID=1469144 RepID=UPI002270143D|nr:ribokinase [Carbonactinospora thermoautotrophica]
MHDKALATYAGGKGANQAVAAARLGARTALIGRVGRDGHGDFLLRAAQAAGVDVTVVRQSEAPSGVALITIGPEGDNSIIVSPGANAHLSPDDVAAARDLIARAAVLALQLEILLQTVTAAEAGTRVVLTLADPLVVNEHEARFLLDAAGEEPGTSLAAQARQLLTLGVPSVVITLGAAGAVVADTRGHRHVPSPRVKAVDTTGAGDAFTGALAWRLARGDDLPDAVGFAVRVGAAAVRAPGAQSSFPTLEEVSRLCGPVSGGS